MSSPILYKANEQNFSTIGLGVLNDALLCLVTEERNGLFELEMTYPITGSEFSEIKNSRLIKVDTNTRLKDQLFKIYQITKPMNGLIKIYAEHISYYAQDIQLKPEVSYSGNAASALTIWKNNLIDSNEFSVYSDIATEGSGKWTIDKVENARRALGGVEGSILDTYGGEFVFDNFHIRLLKERGTSSGAIIAYGKNLTDYEQEEEIKSTYTSIYPFISKQGEGENDEEILITLPEYFIDGDYVNNYPRRKILRVDFSEVADTVVQLRAEAKKYVKANNIGIPKINMKVQFIDLAKTLNHDNLQKIEDIDLCDWVNIYFEKYGIQTQAKVIKIIWNVLLDKFEELELGESRTGLSDAISDTVDGKLAIVNKKINTVQIAANGKNKLYRSTQQPAEGLGKKNDLWYKPVGDGEIEMYVHNGTTWKLEKVSAGLLGGTLDVENGDVNLINVNVANIVGETSNFVRSAWNAINSNADIDGNRLRFVHTDGTSTEIGKNGIKRVTPSDNRNYHYLFYATTFIFGESSSNARWIQLPNDYKGKQFKVFLAIADSMNAPSYNYSIQRFVCTVHPDHNIDYANARVPIISYKSNTLMNGAEPVIDNVQGLLFAIY